MSRPVAAPGARAPTDHAHSVVVFSYNRGAWLENCVASIERLAPHAELSVRDDASDDPATLAALERIARRHEVHAAPARAGTASTKTGGLYPAMQAALDALPDDRLFTFMQDDGQFVRAVGPRDIAAMRRWFDADERHGFLGHQFLRGYRRGRDAERWAFDGALGVYVSRSVPGTLDWGDHFAAILTSRSDRLRAAGFRFAAREKTNDALAAGLFGPRAVLRDPFAADLPFVAFTRHRSRTLAVRLVDRLDRVGLHRLRDLGPDEVDRLRGRDVDRLPWAEDFLAPVAGPVRTPWRYGGFQGRRWLKHLHRVEIGLRRALPAGARSA